MALYLRRETSECLWAVWRMDESLEELEQALKDTPYVAEAVQRFQSLQRRREWLTARLLLHTLTGRFPVVSYHPSGRPYLSDDSLQLSISHTKDYVAVILSPHTVGIDIERVSRRVERVASRFVRDDECLSSYQGDHLYSLLLHWSAKETLFKCLDAAEVDFRHHLRIHPFQLQEQGTFDAEEYRTPGQLHFCVHYLLHPDFVLTYTVVESFMQQKAGVIPIKPAHT